MLVLALLVSPGSRSSLNTPLFLPCLLSLDLLVDVQQAFGLPFYPGHQGQFSLEEKSLSLKIMQYVSNFIRSG